MLPEAELEHRVREFFLQWSVSFDAATAAFGHYLSEDCDWDQRPMARTRGIAAAQRFMRLSRRVLGMETIDVEIAHLAVRGDVVHTARIDHLRRADGSLIVSVPVAGVMTFREGRIAQWREYFDSASVAGGIAASGAMLLLQRLRHLRR